jgi:hypothetical protein
MKTVEIGGNEYSIAKLNAFQQLHLARKLAPLLTTFGVALEKRKMSGDETAFLEMISGNFADALATMREEDVDFIIHTSLSVCARKQVVGVAAPVFSPVVIKGSKELMFQDMDLAVLVQLTLEVIEENLGSFFTIAQPSSPSVSS